MARVREGRQALLVLISDTVCLTHSLHVSCGQLSMTWGSQASGKRKGAGNLCSVDNGREIHDGSRAPNHDPSSCLPGLGSGRQVPGSDLVVVGLTGKCEALGAQGSSFLLSFCHVLAA